ncbi:hypothetical protein TNCV_440661 [Trichonephila clavipes]|nr:hypothetical protein TNCV_440661 [Trichonephila clavipes]
MRLQKRKGTVDGYEWRCRKQSKDNRHDVVRVLEPRLTSLVIRRRNRVTKTTHELASPRLISITRQQEGFEPQHI